MNLNLTTKQLSQISLCTALMAVFSQISIPLPFTPVPVTLQIFGIILISVIVEHKIATLSLIVYTLLGAIGIPVFSSFSGGIHVLAGPSGGYIFGFIILAFLCGFASSKNNKLLIYIFSTAGLILDLILGAIQLKFVTSISMNAALIGGVYPFILKDLVTIILAIFIALQIKPRLYSILKENGHAAY